MFSIKKSPLRLLCFLLAFTVLLSLAACGGNGGESGNSGNPSGGEIDMKDFPEYVQPDEAAYAFTDKEIRTPYWKGNVIYNESVMLVDDGTATSGKLQYTPVRILSVRDYKYETEYVEGVDYEVEGNVIRKLENSSMPYLTAENLKGKNIPDYYRQVTSISNVETDYVMMGSVIYTEGSLIYGHQIAVSYVYDVAELGDYLPTYETSGLPKLKAKLDAGEDITVAVTGDSVGAGCSSSAYFNRPPYLPNFATMAVEGLEAAYPDCTVTLSNQAVGGMKSEWGAAQIQTSNLVKANPDVVFIHFGINDCGAGVGPGVYADNIQSIIFAIQEKLPDCEFVVIKAFTPNELAYDSITLEKYWQRVDTMTEKMDNVYSLDMYTISMEMLKVKKYEDVTGNGINHLNDYSARLYAQAILASLVE